MVSQVSFEGLAFITWSLHMPNGAAFSNQSRANYVQRIHSVDSEESFEVGFE
jgi:hypothetical protein